ncbi:acyl-CoA-binding domain-containing protein 1-like protein, partial [Tanacetum coccineum]
MKDNEGQTPLHYAAVCERKEIGELLVKRNVGTDINDNDWNYPCSSQKYDQDGNYLHRVFHFPEYENCRIYPNDGASNDLSEAKYQQHKLTTTAYQIRTGETKIRHQEFGREKLVHFYFQSLMILQR